MDFQRIIKWIYNTLKYCIDKHNENKAMKVLNQYHEPRAFDVKKNTQTYNAYNLIENKIEGNIMCCEKCGTKPDEGDRFCYKCGYELDGTNRNKTEKKTVISIIIATAVFSLVVGLISKSIISGFVIFPIALLICFAEKNYSKYQLKRKIEIREDAEYHAELREKERLRIEKDEEDEKKKQEENKRRLLQMEDDLQKELATSEHFPIKVRGKLLANEKCYWYVDDVTWYEKKTNKRDGETYDEEIIDGEFYLTDKRIFISSVYDAKDISINDIFDFNCYETTLHIRRNKGKSATLSFNSYGTDEKILTDRTKIKYFLDVFIDRPELVRSNKILKSVNTNPIDIETKLLENNIMLLDDLNIFTDEEKEAVAKLIINDKIICQKRGKEIKLTAEEGVRQLYLYRLMNKYGYPLSDIEVESVVPMGSDKKRADIAVNKKGNAYIIVETKKSSEKKGKEQLHSYVNSTGAPFGIWTNGIDIECWYRKEHNYFEPIIEIPHYEQSIQDFYENILSKV